MIRSAEDLLIDFINFVFFLIFVAFCIIFFIQGNNFNSFVEVLKALVPVSLIAILFLIKYKLNRSEFKKRKREGDLEIILRINFIDKIILEIILYLLPIVILFISIFSNGKTDLADLLQAIVAFFVVYFMLKYLFGKASRQ